jgi:hypothetical protein
MSEVKLHQVCMYVHSRACRCVSGNPPIRGQSFIHKIVPTWIQKEENVAGNCC